MIANLLSGAGGVVLGTILGFLLTLGATGWQERRRKQELKHTVRTLLHLELEQNLIWLEDFWRNKAQKFSGGTLDEVAFQKRISLIQELLPTWSHHMWESQASVLPVALSEEQIKAVFHFHAQLDRFTTLRSMIAGALPPFLLEQYNAWEEREIGERPQIHHMRITAPPGGKLPYTCDPLLNLYIKQFNDNTFTLWTGCEGIYNELYNKGNPLSAPARAKTKLLARFRRKGNTAKQP